MVVAHRGASAVAAEHTLQAYITALERGADGLECDVRLTRDGHLVCVHDRTVNRTSSGTGAVSDFTLAELDALDFSSWHTSLGQSITGSADAVMDRDELPERAGNGVLRLSMLLELVRDAGRPVRLLIETKHPTRYSGLVEKEVVALLARFGWAGPPERDGAAHRLHSPALPVTVMSFAPTALRRVRLLAPEIPTVQLFERPSPLRRDWLIPAWVRAAGPGIDVLRVDPQFVHRLHRRQRQVFVWTVDSPADVQYVLGLGVDVIITNRPGDVITQLRARA